MSFRRYVAIDTLGIAALNAGLNGAYTWSLWRTRDHLALAGEDGIAFDLAGTPVWIVVLSTLLGTAVVRRKLWEGKVSGPENALPSALSILPFNVVVRATALGSLAVLILAFPIWSVLEASTGVSLSVDLAVTIKILLTIVLSLALVPLVMLAAAADLGVSSSTSKHHL